MNADGVLDFQRGEFQALQRGLHGGDVDADGVLGAEPVFPGLLEDQVVDVVFVVVAALAHAHEHAGGDARMQVDQVGVRQGAGAVHAAGDLVVHLEGGAELGDFAEFFGKRRFHAARAWAKV